MKQFSMYWNRRIYQGKTVKAVLILIFILFATSGGSLSRVKAKAQDFRVLDGKIEKTDDHRLQVRTKEMRAILKSLTAQNASVNFTYLGPTKEISHLRNGEVRHQFGLELRAQDVCNVVYVMWHFDPEDTRIHVSVKLSPGKKTHKECLDRGYINNIKPQVSKPNPVVYPNQPHVLTAELEGQELTVIADRVIVWKGTLPAEVLKFKGPVGIRSDNVHVIFDYTTAR